MDNDKGRELEHLIRSEIQRREEKAISFYEYMNLCLYHPEYGYYTGFRPKIGEDGDFYTSASIGGIMGEMLACYLAREMTGSSAEPWTIVEWGGGTGQLAGQILDSLCNSAPDIYRRLTYISIEASAHHRQLQRLRLLRHSDRIQFQHADEWLKHGPYRRCFIVSNELLDAFPVYRALYTQGVWQEIYVEWDNTNGRFKDKRVPLKQGPLLEYINEERIEPEEGQFIEINLDAPQWLRKVAGQLTDGQIITIDYGDVGEELYAAHRLNGTFRCYRNHRAYHDPYLFPGNQDMTSHVNFSACIRAVLGTGFDSRLMTQKQFLLECGILDRLQNHEALDPFSPVSRRNRAIRQLLLSDGMSELFKVLIQTKKR